MDTKLTESLERLHTELQQTQALDPKTRELLEHLAGDIQSILQDKSGGMPTHYIALNQRLSDSITELEKAHPNLVLTIGQVLDHLAQV